MLLRFWPSPPERTATTFDRSNVGSAAIIKRVSMSLPSGFTECYVYNAILACGLRRAVIADEILMIVAVHRCDCALSTILVGLGPGA